MFDSSMGSFGKLDYLRHVMKHSLQTSDVQLNIAQVVKPENSLLTLDIDTFTKKVII